MNYNVNIWSAGYLICDPARGGGGVTTHRLRTTVPKFCTRGLSNPVPGAISPLEEWSRLSSDLSYIVRRATCAAIIRSTVTARPAASRLPQVWSLSISGCNSVMLSLWMNPNALKKKKSIKMKMWLQLTGKFGFCFNPEHNLATQ